ncbi:MAG: hypothetical protein HKN82_19090 [Akkermansiaceae bacterium]|nr:hypothetical protein [Akkermansiaceae bacterium]NNM30241.1 hypothetical protein [Akkermansiaceae bacterium]
MPPLRTILVALMAGMLASHAALPLKSLREMQKKAPEKLKIEVTEVDRKKSRAGGIAGFDFTITADVESVIESAAGLEAGDEIKITYWRPDLTRVRIAGDWPDALEERETYMAYLRVVDKDGWECEPAASSGSFGPVKK